MYEIINENNASVKLSESQKKILEKVNLENDNAACWWSDSEYYWHNGYFAQQDEIAKELQGGVNKYYEK